MLIIKNSYIEMEIIVKDVDAIILKYFNDSIINLPPVSKLLVLFNNPTLSKR